MHGPRFGEQMGSSKNVRKSIGIHQESRISNFGIIKNPKKTITYYKKQGKPNNRLHDHDPLKLIRENSRIIFEK